MLHTVVGGGGVKISRNNALQRCMVQRYWRYEGVGGIKFPGKKPYVTLEWPLIHLTTIFYKVLLY